MPAMRASKSYSCQCACNGCAQHRTNTPSMGGSSNAPEDVVSQMDAEIARLYSALTSLRKRRNSFLPVSRLPVEILTEIFAYCVPRQTVDSALPENKNWFQFSHVSHRWRETSLACPTLWTCPDFSLPGMAQEMLTRSGANLLDIRAIFPYVDYDDDPTTRHSDNIRVLDFALQQAHRIRSFYLETSTTAFTELISQKMNVHAPLLRSLSIILDDDDDSENDSLVDVFQGVMPQLQHLHLRGCFLYSSYPLPPTLSSLGLSVLSDHDTLTWPALLTSLKSLSQLTELSLDNTIPAHEIDDPPPPLCLPMLKVLHIHDIYECVEDFLRLIDLSPPLHLHVAVGDNSIFVNSKLDLLSKLATFLNKSNENEPLRSFCLSLRSRLVNLHVFDAKRTCNQPRLQFQSAGPDDSTSMHPLFLGLRCVPWSSNVEKVSIIADSNSFSDTTWAQAFKLLYNCEQITVIGSVVMSFLDALSSDAQQASLSQPLCLPRLRKVHLEHTCGADLLSRPEWLLSLNRALRGRGLRQMPLEELSIAGSPSIYLPAPEEIGGVERIVEGPSHAMEDDDDADPFQWWTH